MIQTNRNKIKREESLKTKIGIMGGTFDPIHYGHLVTAEAVRAKFNLERVIFVPSGNPPHKTNKTITDKNHRYLMALLATASNSYFDVSKIEIDREGYSYTIDTIKIFQEQFKGKANFYFITGADALNEILTWKDAEILLQMCDFVAATRPDYDYQKLYNEVEFLKTNYNSRIHFVEVPSLAISSTDIRYRVKNNLPIKYLLPESVETYIYKNNLYKVY